MANQDSYPLTRGTQQLIRVNLLQNLWRDTNGYLIHPVVGTANKSLKIADVATASGLWLCEFEKEASATHLLYGFDISPDSFIAAEQLPKNVQLKTVDASKPPPAELQGQFDVVHVRLLQSVIMNDDPEWVISHCMQLLRPGGYLQWEEFDPMAAALHKHDVKAQNLEKLVEILQSRVPTSWIGNLPKHMEKQGMQVAAVERKSELAFHHTIMTYLLCLVFEEYANVYLDPHGLPGSGHAMRGLVQNGFGEALKGSYIAHLFQTVVARKPEIK
ncbi:hypothetical protein MMC17_009156 [Xylographa soralifera]|nr:hypothetical protein [Xylographa soralifera]